MTVATPPPDCAATNIITDSYLRDVLADSAQTREQCLSLIDLITANPPPSSTATQDKENDVILSEDHQQFTHFQKAMYGKLGLLRGENRNALIKVRETKQSTAEARQEVDRLHLQLQNLYYEERHLLGEIAACESYE